MYGRVVVIRFVFPVFFSRHICTQVNWLLDVAAKWRQRCLHVRSPEFGALEYPLQAVAARACFL